MQLFSHIENFNNKVAIYQNEEIITYKKLVEYSSVFFECIKKRSLIMLIAKNTYECVAIYLSAISLNCPILIVDIKTKSNLLKIIIENYTPNYIFIPKENVKELDMNNFKHNLSFKNYFLFEQICFKHHILFPELSLLLPTSGSMGSSKYVRISKDNISKNSSSIIKYLNIRSSDKTITSMPISYSYMLSVLNTHLITGASIVMTDLSIIEKEFWNIFQKHDVTTFNGVPFIYETIMKLGLDQLKTSSLHTLTIAGGKLDEVKYKVLLNFCKIKGCSLITMYGQTEASPRMSYLSWKDAPYKIGSIGKPIYKGNFWLQNENGKKIDLPYLEGELIFEGENVSLGYANNILDLSKGDENKGIINTGDLAFFDKEGFFFLSGRKKRIAKISGNRINLDEIEIRLKNNGVSSACIESEKYIYIFYENLLSVEEIKKLVSELTGQSLFMFKFIYLKNIPRNKSLKVDYSTLEKLKNA